MMKKVIYLYRAFPEKIGGLTNNKHNGVYFRSGTNLVGLDLDTITHPCRSQIVQNYSLREFEVDQNKFELLIKTLPSLGARVTSVEVSPMNSDTSLKEDLDDAIYHQDIKTILLLICQFREQDVDIEAIEFFWQENRIKFTRLAELDLSANAPDISHVLNTLPIGILAGLVPDGDLNEE